MEISNSAEQWRWDEKTDEGEFLHTIIIAIDENDQIYFATVRDRMTRIRPQDKHQWSPIPTEHIYPRLLPSLSVFKSKVDDSIFHKRPQFIAYDGSSDLAATLLREAEIYELLQRYESPVIAQYHGCIVSKDRIIGLALTKYDQTLDTRMKQHFRLDEAKRWLNQIHQAIKLIHSNGLAHNDLNPRNVMINDGNAVIIDFDSCFPLGKYLIKGGTPGWSDDNAEVSAVVNDLYGLQKIAIALGVSTDCSTTTSSEDLRTANF